MQINLCLFGNLAEIHLGTWPKFIWELGKILETIKRDFH